VLCRLRNSRERTYSVDSTVGVVGIIMRIQLTRMVVMMKRENKGCTSI
jgi:hypothetical protein